MVKRNLSQRHDDPHIIQEPQFFPDIRATSFELLRCRLIAWRSAAHRCPDVAVRQDQAVFLVPRRRLIGESKFVKGFVEPVTASVTGKDAARSVAAVGCGGQTEDVEAGGGIPEARNRASPVDPVAILPSFLLGDGLSLGDKAWTGGAGNDPLIQDRERWHRGGV